jgi:hypothetical protein
MTRRTVKISLLALSVAVLASACSDHSATIGPRSIKRPDLSLNVASDNTVNVLHRTYGLGQDFSQTQTIGSAGGVISIPSAGLTVTFPAGAVSSPVAITVTAVKGDLVTYEFEPHGLQFEKPVQITQVLRGTAAQYATSSQLATLLGAYVPNGRDDIDEGGTASAAESYEITVSGMGSSNHSNGTKTATFSINHFSGYIVAWGRSLLGTVTGLL